MNRETPAITKMEQWTNRRAVLTLADSTNTHFVLELVTIIEVTPYALHCRNAEGKAQVLVFGGGVLKCWEEVSERNMQELEAQDVSLKEPEPLHPATEAAEPEIKRTILTPPVPTKARNGVIEVERQ